ncbi:cell wall-binding repeat-containing protein [Miniphocaeibacter massiliensis]|uniref:cell wall-binding repeat-containing protein n=1 Tax=Miniphocaeibacter massiliensis TaxID=2041841 RepID=UPI000C08D116|nr:cell wall-binding repeat-containing protein [Miniphocaeibacter massiliensis]
MKKRILSLVLVSLFMLTAFIPAAKASEVTQNERLNVTRILGSDRYKTAVKVSRQEFSISKYAIIASGEGYADALTGGTLSVYIKAPILLVRKNYIPEEVKEELKRLNVDEVFVLGGEAVISKKVVGDIKKIVPKVQTLVGADRYGTASKVAEKKYELTYGSQAMGDSSVGFDGYNFAEGLPAAPFVGQMEGTYLMPYKPGGLLPEIVIGNIEIEEEKEFPEYNYTRISGNNIYGTAVEVAKKYKEYLNKDIDTIILVSGTNYPDALTSSVLCGNRKAAILLTEEKKLSIETKNYIQENRNIKNIVIVGGEAAISNNVENELKNIR